jgi:hypothetical protein
MLLYLSEKNFAWKDSANRAVDEFLLSPEARGKKKTPDLGR